ncbi:sodium:proton exchanger [Desulfomarina sp.]
MKTFLVSSIGKLDLIIWILVLAFFCGSALLFDGNLNLTFIGAGGVIVEMLLISLAVEIIIECLKKKKGIGTLTGFITNGPEAICLLAGLFADDIVFAASTPLGSNFMNPILLITATLLCHQFVKTFSVHRVYSMVTLCTTALLAAGFFLLAPSLYSWWLAIVVPLSLLFFFFRPQEPGKEEDEDFSFNPSFWLLPSILILTITGYFLDPVVSFAAANSHAPKGVIGFVVLASLTSWPEFKSCIVLLRRGNRLGAILNITVSNITNLWLAAIGIAAYLLS